MYVTVISLNEGEIYTVGYLASNALSRAITDSLNCIMNVVPLCQ